MKNKEFKNVEETFIVLYNVGGGECHKVQLTYDQQIAIGKILMKMHKESILVDQNIDSKREVKTFTVAVNEEDINEEE